MLEIQNQEHFNSVIAFAKKTGRLEQLIDQLAYLDNYANHDEERSKCVLGKDWAPYSFSFSIMVKQNGEYRHWFSGGMIFHGAHDGGGDGGAPTFSVCFTPTDGWAIHT